MSLMQLLPMLVFFEPALAGAGAGAGAGFL